jgi:hypothetical protein
MKKFALIAAMVLAGTMGAQAQTQGQERIGDGVRQRGTNPPVSSKTTTTTTTVTTKPQVTPAPNGKPAPQPPKVVFVPVPTPPPVVFSRDTHRYDQRHHHMCQEKSHRLHSYERHASADGHLSPRERRHITELKRDLDRTCGGHRWRH